MKNLEIITHEKLPHIRYLSLDALVLLTFDAKLQELEVYVTTTRTTANVQVKQTVAVSDLIHSARNSDEGHVFPILRTDNSNVYLSFDELKGYLVTCELCGLEPDSEVCENASAAEAES
ncbi:hypothetical protein [Vibrio harveyi]|uniref:hypothetical protein n=1 Tax=Vibrio harveyi TaxID=669 RepID=UPI003BB50F0A